MPAQEVEAELQRRDSGGSLVDWILVTDAANTDTGKSDPVIDHDVRAKLATLITALADPATETTLATIDAVLDSLLAGQLPDGHNVTVDGGVQTDALTDAELRATPVETNDDYNSGETLADQTGSGGVLTFTFSSAVDLVVIYPAEAGGRADPFGGTPSSSQGIPLLDDAPNYIPVTTTVVKVYADSGTVSVWGFAH